MKDKPAEEHYAFERGIAKVPEVLAVGAFITIAAAIYLTPTVLAVLGLLWLVGVL